VGIERQHYVPQGFLRGFTATDKNSDKFIWVYEKEKSRKPRRLSIKSVAWESYYYEQETEAGTPDHDTVEKTFAKTVDNVAPAIIRSINTEPGAVGSLSSEDQGLLAFFVGISLTRVPSFREPIREIHSQIAQQALMAVAQKDPDVAAVVEKYRVEAEAKPLASLHAMVQVAQAIGNSALQKYWQFFVPPKGITLITSDNPVVFNGPGGPGHPSAELMVNLRKDLALVCTPKAGGKQFTVFKMSDAEARKFNRGVAQAARRFVFADVESEGIDSLVKKYIGHQQTIVL
jgi:hypothetical protein